uniref:Putative secreted protein n=1 Tax=Anopheles marajoara TaxID=58244 RepID=A0A2M4CAS9_9DIPT
MCWHGRRSAPLVIKPRPWRMLTIPCCTIAHSRATFCSDPHSMVGRSIWQRLPGYTKGNWKVLPILAPSWKVCGAIISIAPGGKQ